MYLVLVREAAGSVVMYAVVSLLLVWADSGLVGFGLELVGLVGGASRVRHLHILSVHRICVASSRCGFFRKSRACRDPQCCSGGEGAEVRGGLREWVVSISFGSGGAGPERPFLLVWVLGVARAV